MPGTSDLRVDVLSEGTYVALLDDSESAVDQAIGELRRRGFHLARLAHIPSSVRPAGFGVGLLQVTGPGVAPKVNTSSPPVDAVRPVAELLNYDLNGLLTRTLHAAYGKQPANPVALPPGVFSVTDAKDHFATPFLPVGAPGSARVTAVEVTVIDRAYLGRFGPIDMIFQDQGYNILYSSGTLPNDVDRTLVSLPAGTHAVRVAFLANDRGFIRFPAAVRLRAFAKK